MAGILAPFLRQYQTKNLMIPFLYADLKTTVRQLLEIVVVLEAIQACRSGKQYKRIDLKQKINLLPLTKLNLGFDVTQV